MSIPRPTRTKRFTESLSDSEIDAAKEWGEQHVFGRALLSLLESSEDAKLTLLDENEALAKALEMVRTDFLEFEGCYCGQLIGGTNGEGEPLHICGWCVTDAALAEYAKRKQEREGM